MERKLYLDTREEQTEQETVIRFFFFHGFEFSKSILTYGLKQ